MSITKLKIRYSTWFAIPRGILRRDANSPPTTFDRDGPPVMRLYFHLQNRRRPDAEFVEMSNSDLMDLVGLYPKEFRRAQADLVKLKLLVHEPVDVRSQTHRYTFNENYALRSSQPQAEAIPRERLMSALNPPANLNAKPKR